MGTHIIIDGYNLLGVFTGVGLGVRDIEAEREKLLDAISTYRKVKDGKVTVVFDGTRSGNLQRSKVQENGVTVIFSSHGETADQVVMEIAGGSGSGVTVVTSDREIIDYCEARRIVCLRSGEFSEILESSAGEEVMGEGLGIDHCDDSYDDENSAGNTTGAKKGPSKRASKKERQKEKRKKDIS